MIICAAIIITSVMHEIQIYLDINLSQEARYSILHFKLHFYFPKYFVYFSVYYNTYYIIAMHTILHNLRNLPNWLNL